MLDWVDCPEVERSSFDINRTWSEGSSRFWYLATTSWPKIQKFQQEIVATVEQITEGEYREMSFSGLQ
jgi:hypothetical protein